MPGGKHLRVDIDGDKSEQSHDFDTTIFIGNLPFVTNEEELRAHFANVSKSLDEVAENDGIVNVRVIRDPKTFIGKGIGYIQFSNKEIMKLAIE